MANTLGMGMQLAQNAARFGWYYGVNRLLERQARQVPQQAPQYRPTRPVPSQRELFVELGKLMVADAAAVRDGLYPPMEDEAVAPREHFKRLRAMFADLPGAVARRQTRDATTARSVVADALSPLPDYFVQDFHFQSGGYLTEASARIYDVQVETLFYGTASVMRRAGLKHVRQAIAGRDQRTLSLLDVACGTGRFLRQVRLAFPALQLTGVDLSAAYLGEAQRHLAGLRPAMLRAGNAESLPLRDGSQDIVSCIFLFHELPPEARERAIAEMARVLKPGGTMIVIDSLQMGDRPGWDGMLEAFPVRFHEPYFRQYAIDDLNARYERAGVIPAVTELAFLSKVMVARKPLDVGEPSTIPAP